MAGLGRTSSFLPTIKCSMCAADIEISQMGDHICKGGEPTPPPDSYGNFDNVPFKKAPSNGPGFLKPGRAMPPRVDTSAANRPFFPQDQLTPVSSSPSRSLSPFSPNDGSRSPFGRPLRSATAPLPRGPPSPELLLSNLDSAFPPFPTAKVVKSKPQLAGGYGGMGGDTNADPNQMYAPISPMNATSGGLLKRMNTIAPGPFEVNERSKFGNPTEQRGHQRQQTVGSTKEIMDTVETGTSIQRPATAGAGHSRTSTNSSNGSRSGFGLGLPKQPRKNGYGGFGRPEATADEDGERMALRPDQRSQTFPLGSPSQEPRFRRPSEPDTRLRRPSNESGRPVGNDGLVSESTPRGRKQSVPGPDLTRPLPPRGVSLIRPRTATNPGIAPPLPTNINLAAEFGIGNPYHTPSESQSSDTSGYSQGSKTSSRSSPPSVNAARQTRQPSETDKLDVLMSDVQAPMMDLQPNKSPLMPSAPRNDQIARGMLHPRSLDPSLLSPESPMDPAIQGGRLSPLPARNQGPTGTPVSPPKEKPLRRPTTSKGSCKGCKEPITGRSVSSADGRLTGRYHKQCFVCTTCSEPFQTATFYVHNDAPYCERHYHKLNGSVCKTCDQGIEGQYVESERKQKFHPGCLTCADCKRVLRNDYFEVNNQVYCERDAFRRVQQQKRFLGPGAGGASSRMERRTTRLMMM
ncbi:Paxillin 1 [Hyphodiscus hymeniophilus]|uniref:Paxillin 1 n=1 Tax=Hyphodiscus hymeniophilus TaxID=353542 RepID=A0A9P6VR34_9HELO|nr:Paxillin 1 [Hyphodiscus hymeniophilus]